MKRWQNTLIFGIAFGLAGFVTGYSFDYMLSLVQGHKWFFTLVLLICFTVIGLASGYFQEYD